MQGVKTMKQHKNLYHIDSQGNLNFVARSNILDKYSSPNSLWENQIFLITILGICAVVDFVSFKQLFDALLMDSGFIRWTMIFGLVFAFDIIPIFGGRYYRNMDQRFNVKSSVLYTMAGLFLLAFLGYAYLRLAYQDLALPNFEATSVSTINSSIGSGESETNALPFTIILIIIPILTSVGSFCISFLITNPLKDKVTKLHYVISELHNKIGQVEALLTEYENDQDFQERLIEYDRENFEKSLQQIYENTEYYRNYVRQRLKEHLGNPVDTGILSEPLERELQYEGE